MALDRPEWWRYFGDDESDALDAILVLLDRAEEPDPAVLAATSRKAVELLEKSTGRFFRQRDGSLSIDGTGCPRLWLPYPVVTSDQVAGALDVEVEIAGDDEALGTDTYTVNAGAQVGTDDPRQDPWVELGVTGNLVVPASSWALFPVGPRNVTVTASWGYLEEDGATPAAILDAIVRIVSLSLDRPVSDTGSGPTDASLTSETVEGRSYSYGAQAQSYGLTLDRDVDLILRGYARPPDVHVGRSPNRGARSARTFRVW